jgi:penicillin amidase
VSPRLRRAAICAAVLALLLACAALAVRSAFTPALGGRAQLAGLQRPASVEFDDLGVPRVRAKTREDALAALGYVTARERLVQMDLLRRRSAGELAEVFGAELLDSDRKQRHYGLSQVAGEAVARLPADQQRALEAYSAGVNAYLRSARVLPLEFQLLGYRPAAWQPRDCLLVVLGMFQELSDSEALERTRTIVARHAPAGVRDFLYAGTDRYTDALLQRRTQAVPVPGPLRSAKTQRALLSPRAGEAPIGSNAWAIAGTRTRAGRALVANDMHLDLGIPNVWYRAELRYADVVVAGLTLPGVPLVVAGSNGHVAWGLTNVEADVLDLIELELDAAHPGAYRSEEGFVPFGQREERIAVRGAREERETVRLTRWGPVLSAPLLGRPVAIRWTALDPSAVDLGLLALAEVRDVPGALQVFSRAGMPPLNGLFADTSGQIGWSVSGRYPRRSGFSGAEATSWHDGARRWERYLAPDELPRELNPGRGFLVSANQRMSGAPEPVLGHDYAHGYRAYRIAERLRSMPRSNEADSLALQLDTRSEPLELYRALALAALARTREKDAREREAEAALAAWDGRAERSSRGFALVRGLRRELMERVFASWLAASRAAEPDFALDFADLDTPLAQALSSEEPSLFAELSGGRDGLLREALRAAASALARSFPRRPLPELRWGEVSRVAIAHPLGALPGLSWLFDMPQSELAGCGHCVRMNDDGLGASERMVVAPGREREGIFHMPGGQSGSPFSPHYDDQQSAWVSGRALPFSAGAARATLALVPAGQTDAKGREP